MSERNSPNARGGTADGRAQTTNEEAIEKAKMLARAAVLMVAKAGAHAVVVVMNDDGIGMTSNLTDEATLRQLLEWAQSHEDLTNALGTAPMQ